MIRDELVRHLASVCADTDASPLSDAATEVGVTLDVAPIGGRFRPLGIIGEGGMAVVYRALDLETGQEVALKVPNLVGNYGDRRFKQEGEALGSVRSPAIVGFVGKGTADEPYLAMELIRGRSLAERLVAGGGLGFDATLAIGRRVAAALTSIHLAGWVHRDIKPGNVVLTADGGARLVDFGLARPFDGTGAGTQKGQLVGTLSYLAPEQLGQDQIVDARCDVFALGCILFEMMTGQAAFRRTLEEIFRGAWSKAVHPRLFTEARSIPRPLGVTIGRFTAIDPFERPRDGFAALSALLALDATFDATEEMLGELLAEGVRDIVAAAMNGPVVVTGGAGVGKSRGGRAAALYLAEVLAPSAVVVLRASARLGRVSCGHAAALEQALRREGFLAASRVLSGGTTRLEEAQNEPSFVLFVDDANFLDPGSVERIRKVSERGLGHVIMTVRPGETPPHAFARVHLAGHGSSPRAELEALSVDQQKILRSAAAFGTTFDTRRVSMLHALVVDETLVGAVGLHLDRLAQKGILERIGAGRYAFARTATWELLVSTLGPDAFRTNVAAADRIDVEIGAFDGDVAWVRRTSAVWAPPSSRRSGSPL